MNAPIQTETLLLDLAQPRCEHCQQPFTPRSGSGGKPQRFCSPTCRQSFHAAEGLGSQRRAPHVGEGEKIGPADPEKSMAVLTAAAGADTESVWTIPAQHEIEIISSVGNEPIKLIQLDPLGNEDATILVVRSNAVALARRILWAAGFRSVGLYEQNEQGGCTDLCDGPEPDAAQ